MSFRLLWYRHVVIIITSTLMATIGLIVQFCTWDYNLPSFKSWAITSVEGHVFFPYLLEYRLIGIVIIAVTVCLIFSRAVVLRFCRSVFLMSCNHLTKVFCRKWNDNRIVSWLRYTHDINDMATCISMKIQSDIGVQCTWTVTPWPCGQMRVV